MERAWKCMDETALIAFGILLEETTREVLGETGDLAFTEAADKDEERVLAAGDDEDDGEQKSDAEPVRPQERKGRVLSPQYPANPHFVPSTPSCALLQHCQTACLTSLGAMAPKIQANPQKAATILAWFHKTAQAHSIKDLEKTLPQVGAISNMHVKDYLQCLADDNKIRVEKIGSGNWYWSFPSDEKKAKDTALEKAQADYNKINATVADLRLKVDEAGAARAEDEDMLMDTGGDRKTLLTIHGNLSKDLEKLRTELAAYSEQDPVEVEKKAAETQQARLDAEKFTDHIYSMEGWLQKQCALDQLAMTEFRKSNYGDELDEEAGALREL
ncbi:Mnd1 family-domain-containing protein [Phaeosphaeria sp. MPI-PUGE-AT-0046c]|nr:Mnd1 family-domain-containing protein [Phaeosphaeria sp. MPI-PUGE-AT-0046c]